MKQRKKKVKLQKWAERRVAKWEKLSDAQKLLVPHPWMMKAEPDEPPTQTEPTGVTGTDAGLK